MKELKLNITIDKPAHEVFDFCVNPENTPRWIDSIVKEETNEWPSRLGTIYKNTSGNGEWAEYKMTEFEEGKKFTMSRVSPPYHVRYMLTEHDGKTDLEYYEWVESGELGPFPIEALHKLKSVMEGES